MKIRQIASYIALVAITAAAPLAMHAKTLHIIGGDNVVKAKMVQFSVKNTSNQDMAVRIAGETVTLKANAIEEFKVPLNAEIVAAGDSAKHKDGELLVKVAASMNGVLCNFN